MKRLVIILVILILLIGGAFAAWQYLQANPAVASQLLTALDLNANQATLTLEASGTIEAEEVAIVSELGGRVIEVRADEGDEIKCEEAHQGDQVKCEEKILVRLDAALLEAQMDEARSAVETARANLAQVQAGSRDEEIAAAQAALTQAQARAQGALLAWYNAVDARDNPLELKAQIDEAHTQVALAEQAIEQVKAQLNQARADRDRYQFDASEEGKTNFKAYSDQVRGLEASLQAAMAARDGAQKNLEDLLEMKNNPLVLSAQANAAYVQYQAAQKGVELAQAALAVVEAGPRQEDVDVALAQVHQAQAALGILQTQVDKMTLRSPLEGLVTGRMIHEGEMAAPGVTLLTVANLEEVKLTVYIPEDEIGRVKVGQRVEVTVDSYPDTIFEGWVSYTAREAEFTPKNVQTKKERVNMVFAVKVTLPNPTHALKPGMPADAAIYLEEFTTPIPTPTLTPTPTPRPGTPTPTAHVEVAQATSPTPTVIYFDPTPTPISPTPPPTPTSSQGPGPRQPSSPPARPELEGQIAYSVLNRNYRPEPLYDVYLINVDGSGRRLVASGMRQPDLRGDGWLIANGEGLPNQESLFMVNLDTGEKREVSANANDVRPLWSSDGNRLLFTNTARNEMTVQDGPFRDAPQHILHFEAVYLPGKYPTWLNEGQVVYNGCSNWTYDGKCGLYIAEIRGRMRPLRLTDHPTDIAPAARGTRVVFMSYRDGNWELYAVNTDGQDLTRLTQEQAADGIPVWIGDEAIGFLSSRGGAWAVWAMPPEGGPPWKLFDLNGEMGEDWPDEQLSWIP